MATTMREILLFLLRLRLAWHWYWHETHREALYHHAERAAHQRQALGRAQQAVNEASGYKPSIHLVNGSRR